MLNEGTQIDEVFVLNQEESPDQISSFIRINAEINRQFQTELEKETISVLGSLNFNSLRF
jgi:hypothetical protein